MTLASKDETKAAKDALDSVQKVENEILMDYDFDEYDAAGEFFLTLSARPRVDTAN